MTKSRKKFIIISAGLLVIWAGMFIVLPFVHGSFNDFFVAWTAIVLSIALVRITHHHYKDWKRQLEEPLRELKMTLISDRALTIFESIQFADIDFNPEIFSKHIKRIVEVETESGRKTLCIRIRESYFSDKVTVDVIGKA